MSIEKKSLTFKLVLLGDPSVGKSSAVERFVNNEFFEHHLATIGAAFLTKTVETDSVDVKFEIWDTAGQERYRSLASMYYRDAAAALVMFDITARDTLDAAKTWIGELQKQSQPPLVIALAGNKLDLDNDRKRAIPTEVGKKVAADLNCLFAETSAKTGEGINEIFSQIAKKLPKDVETKPKSLPLEDLTPRKKGGCC